MILDANGRIVVAGTATSSDSSYSSFAVACYDPGISSLPVQVAIRPTSAENGRARPSGQSLGKR